jgi:hypothetical protein
MPTGGARTLADLLMEGRERVGITCTKCERVGSYGLAGLISAYGIDTRLPDLLAELSADCPKRAGQGLGTDRCGAVYLLG